MDGRYEDVEQILKIVASTAVEELYLEIGEFKLIVKKRGVGHESRGAAGVSASESQLRLGAMDSMADGGEAAHDAPRAPARSKKTFGAEGTKSHSVRSDGIAVKAPMLGTFYRAPAPGAAPFVDIGSRVSDDDTVGIIEVMKLMNSIPAGCRGQVVEICVENGTLVEFGQTLMVIEAVP